MQQLFLCGGIWLDDEDGLCAGRADVGVCGACGGLYTNRDFDTYA